MDMKITVDDQLITVNGDDNLLAVCLSAKLDVPYFCWHPALGSVGSCRQCAVKLFQGPEDTTGRIVMACMTKPTPGMRVSIADVQAVEFREAVVETVLTNHPHDCPVCEVGGECHLQDMTVMTGHKARRYRYEKRTNVNQDLGPFIRHEMNRCIGCYRCVRYYQDYAGGDDFGVFGSNRNVYFGRDEDGALESPFAGNLVEVCPTGVFVDKPFSAKFRRKWDMRATPSVCPHCAVGCNITLQERGGQLRRVVNRYNETLNGYFLCDRGRFGTGFVESPGRLRNARNNAGAALSDAQVRAQLADIVKTTGTIGIGSPRASIEANFALRQLVGAENFYAGLSDFDAAALHSAVAIARQVGLARVQDAEQADAVLVLGDDPAAIAPRLALALRQAAQRVPDAILAQRDIPAWDAGATKQASHEVMNPFVVVTSKPSWLDSMATLALRRTSQDIIALAVEVASGITTKAVGSDIASGLLNARQPVIAVSGEAALLNSAANIVLALRAAGVRAKLSLMLPEANSLGLGLIDARPLSAALAACKGQNIVILENDVFLRSDHAGELISNANNICVLDHIETTSVKHASLVAAVGSFADSDGTFVNCEGRAQRFYKGIFRNDEVPQSWALLRDAGVEARLESARIWPTHAALLTNLAATLPELAVCAEASPEVPDARPATLSYRYSGRTAATAHIDVREPLPHQHDDSPLGTTMEGPPIHAQSGVKPVLWTPGWNSGQAVNKFQDVIGGAITGSHEVFAFETSTDIMTPFAIDIAEVSDSRVLGLEELSELSPAIIARNLAGPAS
ncbi:MAG: NADH-quinone oxidoreductase subunit NuoG [Acidocella sp.]|nr:NADH-quinone oxidoreductase subunit NuoG [Acidocella sp.]MDE8350290.1 NADH-quinone oxidoreductase subunit NuoG [Acidocella sp.]